MGSSTEEAHGTINSCAHCREAATLLCFGCHKAPDAEGGLFEPVWYCSAKCQKADWKFHKHDCRKAQARTSLYRVAETAKLAYFVLAERNFDLDVVGVEEKGNTLYIREGPKDRSIFHPFPAEHFNNDQDKQAIMARINGGSADDYVRLLVETMLQGIPFCMAEVHLREVKYLRRIVIIEPDGRESHGYKTKRTIFHITINEDESYALDVAGARFGFYDPLTPWESYKQNRIETLGRYFMHWNPRDSALLRDSGILSSSGFSQDDEGDATENTVNDLRDSDGLTSWSCGRDDEEDATENTLTDQFEEIVGSALESWQGKNGAFPAMLKLREEAFREKQGELLNLIDEQISTRKKQLQEVRDPKQEALLATGV